MTIDQLGSIVAACIVSAGGIGGIVIAVVKFSSDMIASRLSAKYESKLQKEMEKFIYMWMILKVLILEI